MPGPQRLHADPKLGRILIARPRDEGGAMGGVTELAERAGIGAVLETVPLAGGANNRVARLNAQTGSYLLKSYFRHPDDPRDRLGAESGFSNFAWNQGVRCIPKPIAHDAGAGLGLFEFVPGERPTAAGSSEVEQ